MNQQILQHPSLRQGEPYAPCHCSEALPKHKHPDPAIMTILSDMGFDPYKTWVKVRWGNFPNHPASEWPAVGCMSQGKPVPPRVMPRPCLEDLSDGPILPERSASEPALHTCPLPTDTQLPEQARQPGQRASDAPACLPFLFIPACRAPTPAEPPSPT
ncbi:Hypothetical predicted protein, partial [Marmota monax]